MLYTAKTQCFTYIHKCNFSIKSSQTQCSIAPACNYSQTIKLKVHKNEHMKKKSYADNEEPQD